MKMTLNNDVFELVRVRTVVFVMCSCFGLAGCGSTPQILTDTSYCCRPAVEQVYTFRVEFEDMPEFLKPMLRDEASNVLHTKNLKYTEDTAHAVLNMAYVDRTYEGPDSGRDEAWETSAPAGGMRFIAEVQMELRNTVTSELIWSGSMSRLHNVYEGSYMHEAPARAAMAGAFRDLFADFPDSVFDEY